MRDSLRRGSVLRDNRLVFPSDEDLQSPHVHPHLLGLAALNPREAEAACSALAAVRWIVLSISWKFNHLLAAGTSLNSSPVFCTSSQPSLTFENGPLDQVAVLSAASAARMAKFLT